MKSKVPFLDLGRQYRGIRGELSKELRVLLNKGQFIGGPAVSNFEKSFSSFVGATHAVGVGNGTDALEIAIEALKLPKGSEILVPANSFISSAEAVTRTGHKVKFVDVDPSTYLIDFAKASQSVTPKTKAVITVHLYGNPVNAEKLSLFAKDYDLRVIEDCAQAHGAISGGQSVGSIGDIAAFSFYPGKNLGAYGDAGAVTTHSNELATTVRMIANHGRLEKYNHAFEGRNSRLDSLQAAVLSVKLKHIDSWTNTRITNAQIYMNQLREVGDLVLPVVEGTSRHVFHLFVVQTERRDELKEHLSRHGIETGIHYPLSLPQQPAYQKTIRHNTTPIADKLSSNILSLPVGEHLSPRQISYVIDSVKMFFKKAG